MRYDQYDEVRKEPIRTKDMLLSLCQSRPAILKLRNKGKEYDPLIDILVNIDINADDHIPLPSSKDLQTQLTLKPAKLKKWLDTLYEDFLMSIQLNADMIQITTVEHVFCVYGRRNFVSFSCRLPVTPRIGESVNLPFITAHMRDGRHGNYYVYRIEHDYSDNKVIITLWVRVGSYNRYAEYLRDRAEFEGKLDRIDQLDMDDYDIKKKLKELYQS